MRDSCRLQLGLILALALSGLSVGSANTINVAPLYGVASADTYWNNAAPEDAIDGVIHVEESHWNAGSHGTVAAPHWLIVDLGFLWTVDSIVVVGRPWFPESNYFGYTNEYNLYASLDGDDWTFLASGTWAESVDPAVYSTTYVLGPNSVWRYVKYEVVGGDDWAALQEIEVFVVPPVPPAPPEPVSVLEGTWQVQGLISGDSPAQTPGWYWLTLQMDCYGNAAATSAVHDSLGNSDYVPTDLGQFTVTRWGTLVNSRIPSYLGAVTGRGDLITAVATMAPGDDSDVIGHNLQLLVKRGSDYVTEDLAGTWWMHHLNSGDSPGWTGWTRAKLQIGTLGGFSFVSGSYLNSDGLSGIPQGGTASVTSDGTVAFSVLANSHGALNVGRDLMVITADEEDGFNLSVLQKRSGQTFATADLTGTWHMHGLISGDAPQVPAWAYGNMEIDASGHVDAWASGLTGKVSTLSTTASLTADGLFTLANNPSVHGTMSDDKNVVVYTATSSAPTGGYILTVLTRQTGILSPVHRFWSPVKRRHFYTIRASEKYKLIDTYSHIWTYEGPTFYACTDGLQPDGTTVVYRFWSDALSAHFYTISESEKTKLVDNFSHVWTFEGPALYAYPQGQESPAAAAVYRFWSESLKCHFYTISETEKDKLIAQYAHVWAFEGPAWYAYE